MGWEVRSARQTEQSFTRPDGFDLQAFANRAFGVYQNDAEYSDVVWRSASSVAQSVQSYEFHPRQTIEDELDGAVTEWFKASGWLEMCWHLYAWGDKVGVIEPKKLAAMVNPNRRPDFSAIP